MAHVAGAAHTLDGGRPAGRRTKCSRRPALVRARLRVVLFAVMVVVCVATGALAAAVPAGIGLAAGSCSILIARRCGDDLSYSHAVLDWLLVALAVALAGGLDGALVLALPALPFAQLAGSPRSDWPILLLPAIALIVVLAIADPALGGNRTLGLLEVSALIASGAATAALVRRPPRRTPVVSVDDTTGFYTTRRLPALLDGLLDDATRHHAAVSVVYLRLSHFQDVRDFLGKEGAESLVATVARRIGRHLAADDLAFRVAPDAFVVALPGRSLAEARRLATVIDADLSASLIGGRRQRLTSGAACFPTVRNLDALLREARTNARHETCELALAVAQ